MKAFIVDGLEKPSHTFLRSDLADLGEGWTAIDVETLSIGTSTPGGRFKYSIGALWLIVQLMPQSLRLLLNSRWKTVLHGFYLAARLLPRMRSGRDIEIRCHFMAKAAIASYVIARIKGRDFVMVCHGSDLYSAPRGFDVLLAAAARVECVTFFAKGFVYGRLSDRALGKAVVRRNLLSPDAIALIGDAPTKQLHADKPLLRLVGIGRLVPQKDFAFALKVLAELEKRCPGWIHFDLVGDGPLRAALEEQSQELGLAEVVHFHGEMEHPTTLQMLEGADGFLLPCLEQNLLDADGLPVVFQEALSRGVPIFCRQAFGVSELVIPHVNGHAFEAAAPPARWAEVMADVLGRFSPAVIVATTGSSGGLVVPAALHGTCASVEPNKR